MEKSANKDASGKMAGAGTRGDELNEAPNPLLINLVVKNICKYLTFQELKVCRQLNHLWKETTEKLFMKRCPPLRLLYPSHSEIKLRNFNQEKELTVSQFMEIYSDPNHVHPHSQLLKQYRNFQVIGLNDLGFMDNKLYLEFYSFLTTVGTQMTSLHLENVYVLRGVQDFMDLLSCKYTPNLEDLRLLRLGMRDPDQLNGSKIVLRIQGKENKHLNRLGVTFAYYVANGFGIEIPWLDLLSLYPKLKALSIELLPREEFEKIAIGLAVIRKADETKLKLTELEYSQIYSKKYASDDEAVWRRIFMNIANLPLEKIVMDDSAKEVSCTLIQDHSRDLNSLSFDRKWERILLPPIQSFPVMIALKEMILVNCCELELLTKVPNVQSLSLTGASMCSTIRFPETTPNPLVALTQFRSRDGKEWKVFEMEQLVLWMPNIQVLEMQLDNIIFSWVCQHVPNLKELIVLGENLDDSGVVGDFGGKDEGLRPNIKNLRNLETFRMNDVKRQVGLTEKSVFHGFSLMPKLTTLTLSLRAKLSNEAMNAITKKIKNVQIKFPPAVRTGPHWTGPRF